MRGYRADGVGDDDLLYIFVTCEGARAYLRYVLGDGDSLGGAFVFFKLSVPYYESGHLRFFLFRTVYNVYFLSKCGDLPCLSI